MNLKRSLKARFDTEAKIDKDAQVTKATLKYWHRHGVYYTNNRRLETYYKFPDEKGSMI